MNTKKTNYLRSSAAAKKSLPPRKENIRKNAARNNTLGTHDETLDESYWKDSFDKLLDDKPEVLKKKSEINASYNRNSSMEDTLPKKSSKIKKRKVKSTEQIMLLADKQMEAVIRKKMLKKSRDDAKKVLCSTPVNTKHKKNMLLNISAIENVSLNNTTILYNDVERGPDRSKLYNPNTLFLNDTNAEKENCSGNSPLADSFNNLKNQIESVLNEENSSLLVLNDTHSNMEKEKRLTKSPTLESFKEADDKTLSDDEILTVNRFSKSNKRRFYSANKKIMDATTGTMEDNLFDRLKSSSADDESAEFTNISHNSSQSSISNENLDASQNYESNNPNLEEENANQSNNSMIAFDDSVELEVIKSPPPLKRARRSVQFLSNLKKIYEITFQDNRGSKENASRRSSRLQIIGDAAGRKKSSLKSSATNKKSVNFTEEPIEVFEINKTMTERQPAVLTAGKWRKSMALWKKSRDAQRDSDERQSNRRISIMVSNQKDLIKMTKHLQESLCNTLILAQSDDTNLSAISVLDDSTGPILHADFSSRRKSQRDRSRKTSVFEKSSNLFGVRESLDGIDVVEPAIDYEQAVLRRCGQVEPLVFDEIYSESQLPNCRKIGEGVYGEVFMKKSLSDGEPVVLKIIPIEGHVLANGEPQKNYQEILPEIVISMELSNLRHGKDFMTNGFVNVKQVTCVQGVYPVHLLDLWELYRDNHGTENDHPEIFPEDQLYIVFELGNAGQDLEAYNFDNGAQSFSAFLQTAVTLAVAEEKFQFEHRDLHWGNILLAPTAEKFIEFRVGGKTIKLPTHGVKATIIDFTLSRMVFEGCCMFNDLSKDEDLFSVLPGGDYQFEIYKLMRKELNNEFVRFEPYTNTLWLHYMIDKLINGARYRNTKTKKHRAAIHDMMQLRDELQDYRSAYDYVKCLI